MLSRFEQFSAAIFCIHRDVQKIERDEMEAYGLKGAFAQYLLAIRRYPQGLTAARLSEVCGKDKAAVSRALAEMERKGLISRACPGDTAYRAQIHLTEAGERAAAFVSGRATVAVELAGNGLSDGDRRIFYAALDLIAANLQTISAEGLPKEAPGSAIVKETEL